MKTKGLPALAVIAILLAAVLAPAMGLSLLNDSNSSVNESSDFGSDSNTNTTDSCSNDTVQSQSPQPTYNDTTNSSATTQQPTNDTDTTEHHVGDVKERVIVGFKEKPDIELIKEYGGEIKHKYNIIPAIAASLPEKAIETLKNNSHSPVAYIERDYEVQAIEDSLPWGVDRIDAELVWNGTEDGCDIPEGGNAGFSINVSIIDTGIDYTHPDLADNYNVFGYDFVNDDTDPMDDNGHGTHCAGIIAAVDNDIGVIGVAPEAGLYAVKVLDSSGSGYVSDVIAGIEWSVNNSMNIISMSLGSDSDSTALHETCDAAYNAGLVLVAAAGNSGNAAGVGDKVCYPARYEKVIAVTATDSSDSRASWSSTGPAVELAAPGVSINSTYPGGGYAAISGTSMACPHVTGTAGLVWNAYPEYTNTEVRQRLQETAEDLGTAGKDTKYGYGLVNASEAASPTGSPDESPVVATPRIYDNTTLEEKTVFERNDSMFINVSISDINGASDLNTVLITILNTTNATIPILNNDTMTQDTPITDGYVYNYSWLVPGDAESGTWTLKVYANDTGGNVGSASVQFVVNFTNATVPENKNITVDLIAMKKHFALNENPEFKFIVNYNNTTAGASKANETDAGLSGFDAPKPRKALKMLVTSDETIKTAVYYNDELLDIAPEIEKFGEGDFNIKIASRRAFRAGLYKLKVELVTDNETYVEEEEFEWGLVSLNTRKSIYKPGETAEFIIVVLDKDGHPVCDTDVSLVVTNPNNEKAVYSTADGTILPGKECGIYNADYLTHVEGNHTIGNHTIDITTLIDGAEVKFSTYFLVQQDYEFDIIRTAKSKIDPIKQDWFDVAIDIESFVGANAIIIKEFVPAEFDVSADADVILEGDTKILTWNKNLAENKTSVSYSYSVPYIWPYLYALGPAEIGYGSETFTEARAWYVAVDPSVGYTEKYETWSATTADTWEEKDLSGYGVPANAVCEVVIKNLWGGVEYYGGVRANGSSLERKFLLHEAEAGGWDMVTMFVHADSNSKIEHYSDYIARVTFTLVGYWDSGTYVEKMEPFTAGASIKWTEKDLSGYGVGANQICEIVIVNKNDGVEKEAGVRTKGSILARKVDIHKAEAGGVDAVTMLVKADAYSKIEAYAETDADIDFYLVGYWTTAPVTYTEKFEGIGKPTASATWEEKDLSGYSVPADAVTEIILANAAGGVENEQGVRKVGSALPRKFDIHEAEDGGKDCVRVHVTANASSKIEFYHEDVTDAHNFYLVGYWSADTTPPTWQNQGQNTSTPVEGEAVLLYAQGKDETALDFAILETNETGGWLNITDGSYGSPMDMGDAVDTWTWSNFTWQNSSITAGTTVGWRIWYNDTSNNWNVTDIQSFVVATPPPPPSTPYLIYGRVFYKNGTACNNPVVNITNMNNSKEWAAKTNASYNYYQLMLSNGTDLNATEVLRFNVRDASGVQFKIFNHTINETEVNNGGLFDFNITLVAPETPFIIYGWVNYGNGTACNGPTVTINNTNTSITWQAETNASYNFYQLILDTTNISADNVLSFNATDGTQFNVTSHTVTQKNITDGGIFDFNITIGIEEPVKIRNYNNTADLDSWAFSGGMGENVTVSWQNSSNGTPTCVIWNSGTDVITVCIYATNFTDGDGVQFNPNATEKIVVRDDGNTTLINWSVVTDYVSNKNESSSSWYNFTLGVGEVRDVYLQLCIPMNVKSGTYNSTFYAKKK